MKMDVQSGRKKPALHIEESLEKWEEVCRFELQLVHENEVFLKFVLLSDVLGFANVSIGLELPTSVFQPAFCYYSNFAEDWQEKFVERHARHHGAKVAHNKRSKRPPEGVNEYYWDLRDFQWEAEANGVVFAHRVVIPGPYGTVAHVGLASFGGCEHDFIPAIERAAILVELAIDAMRTCLIKKYLPQAFLTLESEEKNYLSLVLDGKTTGEIIEIYNGDKTAVVKLQKSMPQKFERSGVLAAAVMALRMGMLN